MAAGMTAMAVTILGSAIMNPTAAIMAAGAMAIELGHFGVAGADSRRFRRGLAAAGTPAVLVVDTLAVVAVVTPAVVVIAKLQPTNQNG